MTVKYKSAGPDFMIPCFEDIADAKSFAKAPGEFSGRIYYMPSKTLLQIKTSSDPNVTWVDFDRYSVKCTPLPLKTLMEALRKNGYPSISLDELVELGQPERRKTIRPAFKP